MGTSTSRLNCGSWAALAVNVTSTMHTMVESRAISHCVPEKGFRHYHATVSRSQLLIELLECAPRRCSSLFHAVCCFLSPSPQTAWASLHFLRSSRFFTERGWF